MAAVCANVQRLVAPEADIKLNLSQVAGSGFEQANTAGHGTLQILQNEKKARFWPGFLGLFIVVGLLLFWF